MVLFYLSCFAFMAGFVDAMVGGGGLIQLPALFILYPQLSLLQSLATNKTANFFGTLLAASKYVKRVTIDWRHLLPAIVAAFVGAFSGALLVSYAHKEQFMPFIICALLIVLAYTVFRKNLGQHHKVKALSAARYYVYAIGTGLLTGAYDGVIGPGTGSFLIFAFIMLFGYDFLHASANAKIINCVTNIAALIFFLAKGGVIWSIALPVGAANMAGSYAGSHLALKKGSGFIRIFFILVVLALVIKLVYNYI